MKVSKEADRRDTEQGLKRYVDQPGQWKDVTPKAVKERSDKMLASLAKSIEKRKAKEAATKKKKKTTK